MLLEVADRLSLKGELEVAREIQLAMLPSGTYRAADIEICGVTRPANTVGGDFYDVLPLRDGRVIVTLGDVAGKGSPAALLMALLLAVLRTLVDEELEAPALVGRLNVQICRHSPSSRFITLFYGVYTPATGALTYVNAGQNPPLIRRARRPLRAARQHRRGARACSSIRVRRGGHDARARAKRWCCTATASPKRKTPPGQPFEEAGLESWSSATRAAQPAEIGTRGA